MEHAYSSQQTQAAATIDTKKRAPQRPAAPEPAPNPLWAQLSYGNQLPPSMRLSSEPVQRKQNTTGLPDTLKTGIEHLSGLSMDDVQVHYQSSQPARVQALAYTQSSEIHVGPGQEQHLAHEAWHVVQQKQGRVEPTRQLYKIAVNDDATLEREAEVMGERASQVARGGHLYEETSPLLGNDSSERSLSSISGLPVMQGYFTIGDHQEIHYLPASVGRVVYRYLSTIRSKWLEDFERIISDGENPTDIFTWLETSVGMSLDDIYSWEDALDAENEDIDRQDASGFPEEDFSKNKEKGAYKQEKGFKREESFPSDSDKPTFKKLRSSGTGLLEEEQAAHWRIEQYRLDMAYGNRWGGEAEAAVIADSLDVRFRIYQFGGALEPVPNYQIDVGTGGPIYILRYYPGHYELLEVDEHGPILIGDVRYRRSHVLGDGHCLFRACYRAVRNVEPTEDDIMALRAIASSQIPDETILHMLAQAENSGKQKKHIEKVQKHKGYLSSVNPLINRFPNLFYAIRAPHIDFGKLLGMGMSQTTLALFYNGKLISKPTELLEVESGDEQEKADEEDVDYIPGELDIEEMAYWERLLEENMELFKGEDEVDESEAGAIKRFMKRFIITSGDPLTKNLRDLDTRKKQVEAVKKMVQSKQYVKLRRGRLSLHEAEEHAEQLLLASLGWGTILLDALYSVYEESLADANVDSDDEQAPDVSKIEETHHFVVALNRSACPHCTNFLIVALQDFWHLCGELFGMTAKEAREALHGIFIFEISYPGIYHPPKKSETTTENDIRALQLAGWLTGIHHHASGGISNYGMEAIHLHHRLEEELEFSALPSGRAGILLGEEDKERRQQKIRKQRKLELPSRDESNREGDLETLKGFFTSQASTRAITTQAMKFLRGTVISQLANNQDIAADIFLEAAEKYLKEQEAKLLNIKEKKDLLKAMEKILRYIYKMFSDGLPDQSEGEEEQEEGFQE